MVTRTIPAGEFKAKCLALMDELDESGGEIVVTKRGRPVARLLPVLPAPAFDFSANTLFVGDVESPLDLEWSVLK